MVNRVTAYRSDGFAAVNRVNRAVCMTIAIALSSQKGLRDEVGKHISLPLRWRRAAKARRSDNLLRTLLQQAG